MCKNSGFRSRIQKSYKKFGIESKNLIIFSESIPNLYPPYDSLGSHRSHRSHRVSLWVGNLTDALWFVVFCGLTRISQIPLFLLMVENLTEALRFVVFFVDSHGFREIQREDDLWKFVLIRGYKSPQQIICVIRGICGFKAKPQISTNFHELFVG